MGQSRQSERSFGVYKAPHILSAMLVPSFLTHVTVCEVGFIDVSLLNMGNWDVEGLSN